jgi:hypothetical protein
MARQYEIYNNTDFPGINNLNNSSAVDVDACRALCTSNASCTGFVYGSGNCQLKQGNIAVAPTYDENKKFYIRKPNTGTLNTYTKPAALFSDAEYTQYFKVMPSDYSHIMRTMSEYETCKNMCNAIEGCNAYIHFAPNNTNPKGVCSFYNIDWNNWTPVEGMDATKPLFVTGRTSGFDLSNAVKQRNTYNPYINLDYPEVTNMSVQGGNNSNCSFACDLIPGCVGFVLPKNSDANTRCKFLDEKIMRESYPTLSENVLFSNRTMQQNLTTLPDVVASIGKKFV